MASHAMTATYALELASRITRDDETIVRPLIELLVGMTDPRGDAVFDSMRTEVLKTLYSQTDDFRSCFRTFIGEKTEPQFIQEHVSTS